MKGYCSSGDLDGALELLKDIEADEVMFNSLLDGCAKQQARELLTNAGVVPSNFTLSIMIKLFGRTRHLDEAFALVQELTTEYNFQPNMPVYTWLMQACFHEGVYTARRDCCLHCTRTRMY